MKKGILTLLMFALLLGLVACKSADDIEESSIFQVNYISKEETSIVNNLSFDLRKVEKRRN